MSDTQDNDRKTGGSRSSGPSTLTLKRPTVEQSKVKQNFAHGRTKTVVVETRRKRMGDEKPASEAPRAASKKLSYKQKFALESLPKKMEEAAGRIAELEKRLADPALFSKDPNGFAKTAAALEKERGALTAMEEEWLELEMLREEIEG